ncbi:DUF1702 family protein [Nonomuraea longicatena]|uniref:DUF1702 family protein n=1 Tax=Nonomuraea longicatena TaxID=83682 RepID=A0ABN1PT91_9ACTN
MASIWRTLRRRILTPDDAETTLGRRGFHRKSAQAQERLETVGRTFLRGYAAAMQARTPAEVEADLEKLPDWQRGFAYEGAGMGLAVLDGLPFGRSDHVQRFLRRPLGDSYRYLVYVGIGWAMARLPRFRWPKPHTLDPVLVPLVLDGYGFHQAYFNTARYVGAQYREAAFPWPGGAHGAYADKSIDQGIGRALWFVGGTDPERVADLIEAFPAARRGDLYSGTGLAATYAGGVEEKELRALLARAAEHRGELAQACAFAADARARAGIVPEHTAAATRVFCGTTPEEVARIAGELRPSGPEGDLPAYEVWRRRLATRFVSSGGVNR